MATRQVVPALCPHCGSRFMVSLDNILDVGSDPSAKSRLLQGQVNIAKCPQCGQQAAMMAPLFYHDPEKQLALTYVPDELGLHNNDQQKIIGDMSNALLNSLPAEQRKAYLLTPQVFINMQRMTEQILKADGITPEMLARQKAKAQLLDKLIRATNEEALKALVKENETDLDYDLFRIMTASARAAYAEGQEEATQAMLALRNLIAEMIPNGAELVSQANTELGFGETLTREKLLDRLLASESDEESESLIAAGRPLLDYAFFQRLTQQIDAAPDTDTATKLKQLRSRILDISARQDEEARQAIEQATGLLKTILQAEDPRAAAKQHLDEVDDMFFSVLSANIQQARAAKQEAAAQRLEQLGAMILELVQEGMQPEVGLLNQLLQARYPEDTQRLLEANREIITDELIGAMNQLVDQMDEAGQGDVARHVRQVADQARQLTSPIVTL